MGEAKVLATTYSRLWDLWGSIKSSLTLIVWRCFKQRVTACTTNFYISIYAVMVFGICLLSPQPIYQFSLSLFFFFLGLWIILCTLEAFWCVAREAAVALWTCVWLLYWSVMWLHKRGRQTSWLVNVHHAYTLKGFVISLQLLVFHLDTKIQNVSFISFCCLNSHIIHSLQPAMEVTLTALLFCTIS